MTIKNRIKGWIEKEYRWVWICHGVSIIFAVLGMTVIESPETHRIYLYGILLLISTQLLEIARMKGE